MKIILEVDGDDGCPGIAMQSISVNGIVKMVEVVKFEVMCIWLHKFLKSCSIQKG
jgi:hypothetical protein